MSATPVLLLLTNSIDYVSDLIVDALGTDLVFRYNSDLWSDYSIRVTPGELELTNPAGRKICGEEIAKVYRRSNVRASTLFPDRAMTAEERYMEEELYTAWNDLAHVLWREGKVVLVQPYASMRLGKLQQLQIAAKHFPVTPCRFLLNRPDLLRRDGESVVKSFTFKFDSGVGFYSRLVRESDLDPACPWFLTDYVHADCDVTVAVVRDEAFAFSLDRSAFIGQTIDWRQAPSEYAHRSWMPVVLPPRLRTAVFAFMEEIGAHYARLDFLRTDREHVFLEANFTGEWGWLDAEGRHGLKEKILREIDPRTPCVSGPRISWV